MEIFVAVLGVLLANIPLYIAWLVGIVIAIVRWQRHPRISLFVTIGLAIMLLVSLSTTVLSVTLPQLMYDEWGATQIGAVLGVIGVLGALLHTAAWVLILLAVFGGRSTPALERSAQ